MTQQYDPTALRTAEDDIRARLATHYVDLDLDVQEATSNLYRAATVMSRSAEKDILAEIDISWSGFTVLWVLWVWGEMDSSRLAAEVGLTTGTLTGVRRSLENLDLVNTGLDADDRRRRLISLTEKGTATIEGVYPRFNRWTKDVFSGLTPDELRLLSRLLANIIVAPATDRD